MSIRNYPATTRIYLDMDGPLADFEVYCNKIGKHPNVAKLLPSTYTNLPVVAGAQDGVKKLIEMGFQLMVLTKIPSKNPFAATEKIIWLNKNFPELGDMITITPDKGSVGRAIDFLVDDRPDWANASEFKGTIVKYTDVVKNWYDVINYFSKVTPKH